jgi:DNA-binding GntR family transcriptional regulator
LEHVTLTGRRPYNHSPRRDPYASTVDTAYDAIRSLILHKKFVSGQKLSEIGLSDQLGVSRTPIREALRRLANDGYVLLVPKSGAWVASPTKQEVEDAYAVRARLEAWAAGMAAHNASPLFLARLEAKIQQEERIFEERDIEAYLDVNTAFHMIIAEASGNTVLTGYVGDILARPFIYAVLLERYFDLSTNPSLDEHRRLLEAFATGDEKLCVRLAGKHVYQSLASLRF